MIVAAGLSPAWQQILRFDGFQIGAVNRAVEAHWCASGKVVNVAIALAALGAETQAVSLVGGSSGQSIERELAALAIRGRLVAARQATRVCTTIVESMSGRTTELVENAGPVTVEELNALRAAYIQSAAGARFAVITGSLPEGTPAIFVRELLVATVCPTLLDVRGSELLAALECNPLVVKPNREELAATLNRSLAEDGQLHAAMRELNDRGARWVVVTDGPRWAWASGEGCLLRLRPPRVPVVNPIGSGDCLAAGIAWALAQGQEMPMAIRLGLAAAIENVGQLLPARIERNRVVDRAESIAIEEV